MSMRGTGGTAGYNLNPNNFGGPSRAAAMDNDAPLLERVRDYTGWVEDKLDTLSEPIKPYVPRFRA